MWVPQIFFEYSVRKSELGSFKVDALPFQVQIQYTRLDGSRCARVNDVVVFPVQRMRDVVTATSDNVQALWRLCGGIMVW